MCGSPLYQSRVFNYNLTEKDPLFTRTSTGIDADTSKGKTRPGLFWQPVGLMISI